MTGASVPAGNIDILLAVEAPGWPSADALETLCDRTITAAQAYLIEQTGQPFPDGGCELSLVFGDDAAMRKVNLQWRDQDKPTNVLSFPACPVEPVNMPGPMLGDILFAHETVAREAAELGISFDNHLTHLLVHGFLHLLGYDHIDDADAGMMEGHETRILAMLDLSDPYENTIPV
ncbi:MAG: rRNA maturation RNase YbeY [Hyphomicrobiales bacterium]|nr:rRNA maturation RNase YbeY [Hyphomicrobiales bacterium]MCP4999150.1 rRNA maturation RNase YbeY [Hyphomicrobiales bacterium]